MREEFLVLRALRTHGIRTRGFVLDVSPMARRLKKIDRSLKQAGILEWKCKKKGKK
jgi:hypothetical protein